MLHTTMFYFYFDDGHHNDEIPFANMKKGRIPKYFWCATSDGTVSFHSHYRAINMVCSSYPTNKFGNLSVDPFSTSSTNEHAVP
jgi:hypothetical protein